MFFFPANKNGCLNHTDCLRGYCDTTIDQGANYWCKCPLYYNPLTNCTTRYADERHPALSVTLLLIVFVVNAIVIGKLWRHLKYEILRFIYKFKSKESMKTIIRAKLMILIGVNLCCVVDIVAITFNISGEMRSCRIMTNFTTTLFVQNFIILVYQMFILLARSNELGTMKNKWRRISLVIIITGMVGTIISLIIGLVQDILLPDNAFLTILLIISLTFALAFAFLLAIPLLILMMYRLTTTLNKINPKIILLIYCTKIVLLFALFIILSLCLLSVMSYIFPNQLFDVISLYSLTACILYSVGKILFILFFRSIVINKKDYSSTTSSTKTSIPIVSETKETKEMQDINDSS